MTEIEEVMLERSPIVIAVQKGGVMSVEDAADLLGVALQCCNVTRRIAVTFHKSQENLRKQLVKPVGGDYRDLETDIGVVGNQPGQDNTLVRTPRGTLRWADGEEGRALNAAHMQRVNGEYTRDKTANKPAGYDEPGYEPERSEP